MSDSLQPHGLQYARLPCPSPAPRACSNSYPLSQWCHPTISSSVVPFSSCLQSFTASGSFPRNQFFTSGGQSIGVSASASVLPMNIQDWLPLGWTGWISLQSKRLSRIFSNTTVQKHQFFGSQLALFMKYWEGPKRALVTLLADSYWILLRTSDAVLAHSLLADSDRRGTSLLADARGHILSSQDGVRVRARVDIIPQSQAQLLSTFNKTVL